MWSKQTTFKLILNVSAYFLHFVTSKRFYFKLWLLYKKSKKWQRTAVRRLNGHCTHIGPTRIRLHQSIHFQPLILFLFCRLRDWSCSSLLLTVVVILLRQTFFIFYGNWDKLCFVISRMGRAWIFSGVVALGNVPFRSSMVMGVLQFLPRFS